MALPLESTPAGARALCRCAGGALLLLAVAMQSGATLAADQPDSYSATVKVDATADSAGAARELARIDGQRRALGLVVDRLAGTSDNAKLAKLDDKAITDMVESFEVASERMSAVRYLANYTFHFRPAKLRRLVRVVDTASAEGGGKPAVPESSGSAKPAVVLPLYRDVTGTMLWDDPNPWREAWGRRSGDGSSARLSIPLGDAGDLTTIDANRAESGDSEALAAIAQRNGSDQAIVALATARRQGDELAGFDLSVKWYRAGRLSDSQGTSVDALPGESEGDLLKRAADAAAGIAGGGPRKSQQAVVAASVPIRSLGDWVLVRDRLASVAAVRKVDLLSLSRQEARIQIRYVGSPEQLRSSLAEVDLGLGGGDPVWQLQISSAAGSR